ncbi:MAG: hypothetical protein JWR40_4228 [Massilia sp.]|jgi:hypothetical protein|nr:hypothetical protein [Massilia sp.]MDB5951863.1 hypothetical protein [Massilia sp.]
MLAMKPRFYIYLVICVALLVMLVLDPRLLALAKSGIADAFEKPVALLRGAISALT